MYTNTRGILTFILMFVSCCFLPAVGATWHGADTVSAAVVPDADTLQPLAQAMPDTSLARLDSTALIGMGDMLSYNDTTATDTSSKKDRILMSDVEYKAKDFYYIDEEKKRAYFYNEAEIKYGDITLSAGYILLDYGLGIAYARSILDSSGVQTQKPIFMQGEQAYDAYAMVYDFNTKRGYIKNVKTEQTEGYGAGRSVKKEGEDVFYASDFYFSTDEKLRGWIDGTGEETDYYIRSSRVKMTAGKSLVAGFSQLYIADVPTPLVLPFAFFPLNTYPSSGVLLPSYNMTNDQGFGLVNAGYYFVINDYLHLQVNGDIYTKGSWALRTTLNYFWKYHFSGSLNFDFSKVVYGEIGLPGYTKSKPWRLSWTHTQDQKWSPGLTLSASVNFSSQGYYENSLDQMYTNNYINNSVTSSSISLAKSWGASPFKTSLSMTQSQNNAQNSMSLTLPSLVVTMNRIYPFKKEDSDGKKWYEKINMQWTMNAKNTISNMPIDSFMTSSMFSKYSKMNVSHNIPVSASYKVLKYFNLGLGVNYTEDWFFKTIKKHWDDDQGKVITDTIPGFKALRQFSTSASLTTMVFGMFNISEKGKLRAIRHVMSPSLTYTYSPDFSTSFWNYYDAVQTGDRLGQIMYYSYFEGMGAGYPSYGGMSQSLSFSLVNNFEAKVADKTDSTGVKTKKVKLLDNLSTNVSYNFAAQQFKLSTIPVSGSTSFFDRRVALNFRFNFDPYRIERTLQEKKNKNDPDVYVTTRIDELGAPRLTDAGVNMNFSISSADFNKNKGKASGDNNNGSNSDSNGNYDKYGYLEYLPTWSLSMGYTYTYSKPLDKTSITNSVSLNGEVGFSKNWNMSFSTGYDFQASKVTDLRFGFARDLNTWHITLSWAPISYYSSYSFFIGVKASLLKDLKYEQNKSYRNSIF